MAERFLEWVSGLSGPAIYTILVLLSAVENVFPPVPADVAVLVGAFLSHRGLTSAPLVGVSCWLANTVSSAGMYFYARAHGRRFFQEGWPRRLIASPELRRSYASLSRPFHATTVFADLVPIHPPASSSSLKRYVGKWMSAGSRAGNEKNGRGSMPPRVSARTFIPYTSRTV